MEDIAGLDSTKVKAVEKKLQEAVSVYLYNSLHQLNYMQESNLKEFQDCTDISSLEAEYESLQTQKELIDITVSTLQEELDKLSNHATRRGAFDILRKKQ